MSIERAKELLQGANKKKRDELRKQCEALIATWEWGKFMRHHVEPDFMARHKWPRGSPVPGPPQPPIAGAYGHAFDAQGRMVVQHQQVPSDDVYETFWLWGEHEAVGYAFPPAKSYGANRVSVYALGPQGRIDRVDTAHEDGIGALTTIYEYDANGQWMRAHMTGTYTGKNGKANRLEEVERDAKGRLVRLWITQESGHRWAQIDKLKTKATKATKATVKTAAKKAAKKPAKKTAKAKKRT